ncbi:TPA: hypothetical protein PFE31_004135 [Kluyvera ascorbata]|nr:hypothetical protein [Kluyvera ascorbata]
MLWRKYLPYLISNNTTCGKVYDYYSVFFKDVENHRYTLLDSQEELNAKSLQNVQLLSREGTRLTKTINEIAVMEPEIVHYKKNHSMNYNSILLFAIDKNIKIITLKTSIARMKGRLVSGLTANSETISRDRYNLLRLLIENSIHQLPSRQSPGVSVDEVVAMLYGKLWYQHIKNESFRRKMKLLLDSLVVTGDVVVDNALYYVQAQAITTVVEYEKEARRLTQQHKMHKNIVRFMLVMTIATILIILVLLDMAGIVDLHLIWQKVLEIKPVRFMLKFI